jgi:hypothetical protein
MTAESTNWAWKQQLPATPKLVLLALADMAGGAEHSIDLRVTVDELVKRTGLGRRTVQYQLRALEQSHHIVRDDRYDSHGVRLANRWNLNVNELAPVALDLYGGHA